MEPNIPTQPIQSATPEAQVPVAQVPQPTIFTQVQTPLATPPNPNSPSKKTVYLLLATLILLILVVVGGVTYYFGIAKQQSNTQKNTRLATVTTAPSLTQTSISNSNKVKKVAMEGGTFCALLTNGYIKCWGNNVSSIIQSNSNISYFNNAVLIPNVSNAIDISVLYLGGGACALINNGDVKCWGKSMVNSLSKSSSMTTITNIPDATAMSGGGSGLCVLVKSGKIYCAGDSLYRGFNNASDSNINSPTYASTFTLVPSISNAAQISRGGQTVCALLKDLTIECWGDNSNGQLGNGGKGASMVNGYSINMSYVPVQVNGIANAKKLFVEDGRAYAILNNATAKAWGINSFGELGNKTQISSNIPVDVIVVSGVRDIASIDFATCAALTTGEIKCWGNGVLGSGKSIPGGTSLDPVNVANISSADSIYSDSVDGAFCAILTDESVKCWGNIQAENTTGSDITLKTAFTPISIKGLN